MAKDGEPPKSLDKSQGKAVDGEPAKHEEAKKDKDKDGKPLVNGKSDEPAVGGRSSAGNDDGFS